jgi:hypothetical protein
MKAWAGPVNLQLTPGTQSVCAVGGTVDISLRVISQDSMPDAISAIGLCLDWDETKLELLGILDDADSPYAWLFNYFPDDRTIDRLNADLSSTAFSSEVECASDLDCSVSFCDVDVGCSNDGDCRPETFCDLDSNNCPPLSGCCDQSYCFFSGFPFNDGNVLYEAWSQLFTDPALATAGPNGLLVTKFRFRVLATGSSQVRILPACGATTITRVLDGNTPNLSICCSGGAGQGTILNPPATVNVGSLPSPSSSVTGPRRFSITPGAGSTQVALKVKGVSSNVDPPCVDHFVRADGTLGTTAVFRTGTQWGTVNVNDQRIIPSRTLNPDGSGGIVPTSYSVEVNCGTSSTSPINVSMPLWCDFNDDGNVDLGDILIALDGFSAPPGLYELNVDVMPCSGPDGSIDLGEILAVLDAFSGLSYTAVCGTLCP